MITNTAHLARLDPATDRLVVVAKFLLSSRRRRDIALWTVEFGEPAWNILLELYIQHAENRRISVTNLCDAAAVPDTTALRYIRTMVGAGQLVRQPDPGDRRRVFITFAPDLLEAIVRYLEDEMRRLEPVMRRLWPVG